MEAKDNPAPFPCLLAQGGYRLQHGRFEELGGEDGIEVRSRPQRGLALVAVGDQSRLVSQPSAESFLRFSELETDDQILAFANDFGLLRGGNHLAFEGDDEAVIGEPISRWDYEIHHMRSVVDLWRAVQASDHTKLAECISWAKPNVVTYKLPPRQSRTGTTLKQGPIIITSPLEHPARLQQFRQGDLVMPARVILQERANEKLAELTVLQLLWTRGFTRLGFFKVPAGLLGFLWLQFATVLDEHSSFRNCAACGKTIIISPEGSSGFRSHRLTCSNACRVRMHDNRKRIARQLRGQGIPLKDIAKQLHTEVETVEKWSEKR